MRKQLWKHGVPVMVLCALLVFMMAAGGEARASKKATGFTVIPSKESSAWDYIPNVEKHDFSFSDYICVYIGYMMDPNAGGGNDAFEFEYTIYKAEDGAEKVYLTGTDNLYGTSERCGGSLTIYMDKTYKRNMITEAGTYRIVISFRGLQRETTISIWEREEDIPTSPGVNSSGMSRIGVEGTYMTDDLGKAVDRINEIRKEAYEEGLVRSYVPIRLSAQLEAIAQLRAAEAAIKNSHTRPNGSDCFSLSVGGVSSWAEDLAWNTVSDALLYGIEQWYSEKSAYVNKTGGVTGHYTSMINPSYTYVGLGCFHSDSGVNYSNTIAGEFGSDERNTAIRETANLSGTVKQWIEVPAKKISVNQHTTITVRPGTDYFGLPVKYNSSVDAEIYDLMWTSSDPDVATVTNNKLNCVKVGACMLSTNYNGTDCSVRLTFENPITVSGGGTVTVSAKKMKTFAIGDVLRIMDAKGNISYNKISGNRRIGINGKTGKITVKKGLKKGKTYRVQVSVIASGDQTYNSASRTVSFVVKVR